MKYLFVCMSIKIKALVNGLGIWLKIFQQVHNYINMMPVIQLEMFYPACSTQHIKKGNGNESENKKVR